MTECTCTTCGWVHVAVPPEVFEAPRYTCFSCGAGEFREYREGDCPVGATIQPVVWSRPAKASDE